MKVFVAATDASDIEHAREWFCDHKLWHVHRELEDWATLKSAEWGDVTVFIECVVPGIGRHAQCDLLVAFQDRLAICEAKMKDMAALRILDEVPQLNAQLDGFARLLKVRRQNEAGILPCFYLPLLSPTQARDTKTLLDTNKNALHLWVACASSGRLSLVNQLDAGLRNRVAQPAPAGGFPRLILKQLRQPTVSCDGFEDARRWLQAQRPMPSSTMHRFVEYSPALRAHEWRAAKEALAQRGVVEIAGAPGMGRKTLAMDLAADLATSLGYAYVPRSLKGVLSLEQLAETLWIALHGVAPKTAWNATLESLSQSASVFVIDNYDNASQPALMEWLSLVYGRVTSTEGREGASWIIVSVAPMLSHLGCSIELGPVSAEKLFSVLGRLGRPGLVSHEKDHVLAAARGNPRLATWMWRAPIPVSPNARFADPLDWLLGTLTERERRALPSFCAILGDAPLGLTLESVAVLGAARLGRFGALDLEDCADSLATKLANAQLLVRTPIDWELLSTLSPRDGSAWERPCFLRDLNKDVQRFAAQLEVVPAGSVAIESEHETTLHGEPRDNLTFVTASLWAGDLWPFVRSSFRFNNDDIAAVCDWFGLHQRRLREPEATQRYLLRTLAALKSQTAFTLDELERDPGSPASESEEQLFAYHVLVAYTRTKRLGEEKDPTGVVAWLQEIGGISDAMLATELRVRAAGAFQEMDMPERQWELFAELLSQRSELPSPSRGLVLFRALAFLNATKTAKRAIPSDVERQSLIDTLWPELLALGLQQGNLSSICNAVFYATRADVLEARKDRSADLRQFLAALDFVEHASIQRRVQAIQTKASTYRYLGQREGLSWTEFMPSFIAAIALLDRARGRAASDAAAVHWLNTVSYGMQLCRSALKYHDEPALRQPLVRACVELADASTLCRRDLTGNRKPHERMVLRSVVLYHPIVAGIACVGMGERASMIHVDLDALAGDATAVLRKMVADGDRVGLLKELPALLRALSQLRKLFSNWANDAEVASWWNTMSAVALELAEPLGRRDARLNRRRLELFECCKR